MYTFEKLNPLHANKPWPLKYLYSIADPNTSEGKRWHNRYARNLFIAVGGVVALSFLLFGVIL
jgi:hypothetical protein